MKNVEVPGQCIIPEITLSSKRNTLPVHFVMVLEHVYNFFDTLPLRDEGLGPLLQICTALSDVVHTRMLWI